MGRGADNLIAGLFLLQKLIGFKEDSCPKGYMSQLSGTSFHSGRKGACEKSRYKHDEKCNRISPVISHQRIFRSCKKEIKHQHTDNGCNQAVDLIADGNGNNQHRQYKDCDNICLIKPKLFKQGSNTAGCRQSQNTFCDVAHRQHQSALYVFAAETGRFRHLTGDDIDIHIGSICDQLFRQGLLSPEMAALRYTSSDHNLGNTGQPGKF